MITLAASVVSCSDSGTDPEPGDTDEFVKNYIKALFLGTGPLIPQDNFTACVTNRGQWAGFPRGTAVRVVASSTLDLGSDGVDTKQLIEAALATVTEATLGEIQTSFTITNDPDPMPGLNEATGTDHPSPQDTGCAFDRGCVHIQFTEAESGIMISSRATLRESIQPADAFVHDIIGHGVMGMCHIDQESIGGNDKSLMAGGPGAFTGFIPDQLSARHRRGASGLRLIPEPRSYAGRIRGSRLDQSRVAASATILLRRWRWSPACGAGRRRGPMAYHG